MDEDDLGRALGGAAAGDEAAFAALWRRLHPPLLRYLTVLIGPAAPDVASETWLQVARDIAGFRGEPRAFAGWLFRIARNRAVDEQRRLRRRPEQLTEQVDDASASPDAAAETLEWLDTQWALSIIATLPREQAEVIMLRVVAGLDVATTASILGKRPGAVRVAAFRGLRRLAAHPQVRARADDLVPAPRGKINAVARTAAAITTSRSGAVSPSFLSAKTEIDASSTVTPPGAQ